MLWAHAPCEGGLHVVDIRAPAAPRAAGCFSFDGYTHETSNLFGTRTRSIATAICFNSNEDTLTVVDATDALRTVAAVADGYGGSAAHAGMAHRGPAVLPGERRG